MSIDTNSPPQADGGSFDSLVSKLDDLVKLALDIEKQGIAPNVPFIEVYEQLQQLQKSLRLFRDYQKESASLIASIAEREHVQLAGDERQLDGKDKKILSKLEALTSVCEAARERIHKEMLQNPDIQQQVMKKIQEQTSSDEKQKARRRHKFRSLGGDGWVQS